MSQTAIFAGGCFWGVEAAFRQVPGVLRSTAGYTGGHVKHPTYEQVCSGTTGHAEAVQVEFDPKKVSYHELLDHFWQMHDPTQLNRQGPDVGTQYRSVIFYSGDKQKKAAEASVAKLTAGDQFTQPIVTTIEPAQPFYPAEDYHQQYLEKRGLATCTSDLKASLP